MADVQFYAGEGLNIAHLSGSGLGFYSTTFGGSVAVGAWQGSTFVTNSAGSINGGQVDNTAWAHPNSGTVNGVGPQNLLDIPNHLSTVNIRFTHSTAVSLTNSKLYFYDRSNKNNDPSGVTVKCAEIIHPSVTQTGQLGSGDSSWITPHGSGVTVDLVNSPGMSGINPGATSSNRHDHFAVISISPNSIGEKLFALLFETEYS